MASRKIAVLGAGKAGEALIAGLLSSGWRKPSEIAATARHEERLAELSKRHGIETTRSNVDAAAGASIVVIAVKPQDIESLLADLGGTHAAEEHLKTAEDVLGSVGRSVRVDEGYMDAITAVSGSGPAYFALLAESMIEAGILLGLAREIATDLVVQTMLGTAKLLRDEHMHPVELREMVTSPGGTTIRAIHELEQAGVRAAFFNAIQAAMVRSRELAAGEP